MGLRSRTRYKTPPHPALDYRPPPALRMLRATTIMFLTVAGTTIAYVVWWFALAMSLDAGVETWIEARTAEGWTVRSGAREIDGFPFLLRITIPSPDVVRPDGTAYGADLLQATSLPLPAQPVTLRTSGALRFALPPPPPGPPPSTGFLPLDAHEPVVFSGSAGLLEVTLDGLIGLPEVWRARFQRLSLAAPDGRTLAIRSGTARVRLPVQPAAEHTTVTGGVTLHVEGLRLPDEAAPPLGALIAGLDLDADLKGGVDLARPLGETLAKWRDDGGTVELKTLELAYGPLWLRTAGTLALDGALQPVGATTAKIRGFFDAVDRLRAGGTIGGREAITAKLVLGAMARRARDGGPPVLNLPLSLQDRVLHVGPVPLLPIPEVAWPGTPAGTPKEMNTGDAA